MKAALVCASCLTATSPAWAVPTFGVTAEGTCPSQEELTQAVAARGWPQGSRRGNAQARLDYEIISRSNSAGAVVELQRSGGATLVTRRFASHDCRALADAMLVVVEAYFIDVGEPVLAPVIADTAASAAPPQSKAQDAESSWPAVREAAPHDAAAAVREAASPHPNATLPVADAISPARAPVAPRAAEARTAPHTLTLANGALPLAAVVSQPRGTVTPRSTDARTTSSAPIPTQSEESSRVIARIRGFVGVGASLALPRNEAVRLVTPILQLGAGVVFASMPWSTDLLVGSGQRSTAGEIPNRVERWASHALVRVGWLISSTQPELRPWLGAGVQLTSLHAIDLREAQTRTRLSSLAGFGLEATMPIGSAWSTRAELGCVLCGSREHYQVSASESLGYGPRVVCLGTLGFSLEKQP